jgi:hypothetical protein
LSRPRWWLLGLAAVVGLIGVAAYLSFDDDRRAVSQPYALRKDGRIVAIRNCDAPAAGEHMRRCAALLCERAVANSLVNPMEARLQTTEQTYDGSRDTTQISGAINYRTSISIPLPTAYGCAVRANELIDYQLSR